MGAKYRFALQWERGTSFEMLWRARGSCCEDDGTTWFFSSCGGILELRRGFQASSWVGPGKPKLPFELRGKAGGCARVTAGPKRPHLGVCPGPNSPLMGRQVSQGRTPDSPGEPGLASRGSKGLRSPFEPRHGSLGAHRVASRESSHFFSLERGLGIALQARQEKRALTSRGRGRLRGFLELRRPWGFSHKARRGSQEPLVRRKGSQVSMGEARGSASLLSSPGRGLGPGDALKKDSRGLSQGAAGNPRFPRLLPGTLGNFPGCL